MYHYTYSIFCIPEKTYYYGKRSSKERPENDLWISYFSSSTLLKNKVEIYGIDQFIPKIRKLFKSKEEALRWENKLLVRCNVSKNPKFINRWPSPLQEPSRFAGFQHTSQAKKQIAKSVKKAKSNKSYKRSDTSARNYSTGFNKFWEGKNRPDISDNSKGSNNPNAKSVITPAGLFGSYIDAANYYNVKWYTIKDWVKKGKEGFYYG